MKRIAYESTTHKWKSSSKTGILLLHWRKLQNNYQKKALIVKFFGLGKTHSRLHSLRTMQGTRLGKPCILSDNNYHLKHKPLQFSWKKFICMLSYLLVSWWDLHLASKKRNYHASILPVSPLSAAHSRLLRRRSRLPCKRRRRAT